MAASNPCLNCGTNIQLEYCPECGQREIDPDPTLREFLRELAEEMLHWDGKLARTVRLLVAHPGELTLEYLAGRRVRFISPLRVYLTCSVLYFFLSALAPEARLRIETVVSGTRAGVPVNTKDTVTTLAQLDSMATRGSGLTKAWGVHFGRAMRDRGKLSRETLDAVPKAMFVLLPTFAALFALAFRDRRRRYPQHLAFALHVHAVLFLGMAVMLIGRFPSAGIVRTPINLVVGGLLGAYFLVATNRVYGGANTGTLARLLLVFGLYGVTFAATMMAVFAIVVFAS